MAGNSTTLRRSVTSKVPSISRTDDRFHEHNPHDVHRLGNVDQTARIPQIMVHLTLALSRHVCQLHRESLPVPREVEELAVFLMRVAKTPQVPPIVASERGANDHASMPDRLLVAKGEAAERLGVSVRTIERLVACGRLPQVQVERLARFRVSDLEAYVHGLVQNRPPRRAAGNQNGQL
jgi:excisionase family DNA binding protein